MVSGSHSHEDIDQKIDVVIATRLNELRERLDIHDAALEDHEVMLTNHGQRITALEEGVVIPEEPEEPPTSVTPWDAFRVGFAKNLVVPDQYDLVSDTASLVDAMRAGVPTKLASGTTLRGVSLEDIGATAALISDGEGARLVGNGHDPIVDIRAGNFFYNILFEGLRIGDTREDGIKGRTGCNPWFHRCAVRNVTDEQLDLWDPGTKRITFTQCAFLAPSPFGPLMGSNNATRPPVDMWATFVECYFETDGRQPRISASGATAHMVNCFHARWAMYMNYAIDVAQRGRVIAQGPIAGSANIANGPFIGGDSQVFVEDLMIVGNASAGKPSNISMPTLPYEAISHKYAATRDAQLALARQIQQAAGPSIAPKQYAL